MDLGTVLCRVDSQQYPTVGHYLADLKLIGKGAEEYWAGDPRGFAEVSRAKALEDQTCEALARRIPADLSEKCKAIQARGGPAPPPPGWLDSTFHALHQRHKNGVYGLSNAVVLTSISSMLCLLLGHTISASQ